MRELLLVVVWFMVFIFLPIASVVALAFIAYLSYLALRFLSGVLLPIVVAADAFMCCTILS